MKVILLSPLPPPSGGIAGWTQRMQKAKLKNGWTVDVVDEKLLGDRNEQGGGHRKNMLVELRRSFNIWKDLCRHLKSDEVKVVQACIPATSGAMLREIVSAKLTHRRGRHFITHFRCTVPNMIKKNLQKRLIKRLIKCSDSVFCLNQQTVNYILKLNSHANCVLIPNFVELSETYQRENYADSVKRLVYTGRILEEKGCKRILEVAGEYPDIQFELIGKVLMKTDSVPPNVVITGEKDKAFIRQELLKADAFIFLTRFPGEGFSNSLAEAMAYSLPCIVTDWAANKDMMGNEGGIVITDDTVENVIGAIKQIESKQLREQMGKRNYRAVMEEYTEQRVTDMYVSEYEKLVLSR